MTARTSRRKESTFECVTQITAYAITASSEALESTNPEYFQKTRAKRNINLDEEHLDRDH